MSLLGVQLECPEKSYNLWCKEGSKMTPSVYRWEDCARLCRQRVGCLYWVYQHYGLQCETLTGACLKYHDQATTAGGRNCGSETSRKKLLCPSKWVGLRGLKGTKWKSNVQSWEDCAGECQKREKCKYWTWYHQNSEWAFYCATVTNAWFSTAEDKNVISGDKDCGGGVGAKLECPSKSLGFTRRSGSGPVQWTRTRGWRDCARRCSQEPQCQYWTWYKRSSRYALYCGTMTDASVGTVENPDVISGDRNCGGRELSLHFTQNISF